MRPLAGFPDLPRGPSSFSSFRGYEFSTAIITMVLFVVGVVVAVVIAVVVC